MNPQGFLTRYQDPSFAKGNYVHLQGTQLALRFAVLDMKIEPLLPDRCYDVPSIQRSSTALTYVGLRVPLPISLSVMVLLHKVPASSIFSRTFQC